MGAVQILSHSMVQSIEENSVRKGFDPRDFALVAEGGAGPLFAVPIAVEVGTPNVIVPLYPGIAAAMGLVATDMVYEYAATTYQRLSKLDADGAAAAVRGARGAGRAASSTTTASRRTVCSCNGSSMPAISARGTSCGSTSARARSTTAWAEKLRSDFHDIHEREYSRRFEDSDIEVPNIRVRGIGLMPELSTPEIEEGGESPDEALRFEREAWFLVDGALEQVSTRYYERPRSGPGTASPARRS